MRTEHPLAIVVDDDLQCLDALGMYLEHLGFIVIKFAEIEQFYRLVPNIAFRPSIAVIDGTVSGRLKYEDVVRECRRCKLTFPIIVLTGDTSPQARKRAAEAGCQYLSKPVRPGILDTLIDSLVPDEEWPRQRFA